MDNNNINLAKKANRKNNFSKPEISMAIVLLCLCLVLSFSNKYFATTKNTLNILRQIAVVAILGVGEGMIIITGGIDLSVGQMIGWCACVGGLFAKMGYPQPVIFLMIMLAGLAAGLLNGLLITGLDIAPFIVTMGTTSILNGLALMITNGFPISYKGTWLSAIGGGYFLGIPISVFVMFFIVILFYLISKYTVFGRNIYAIGNSEKTAMLSGIRVKKMKIAVYTLTGMLAGICGTIQLGLLNGADASYGKGSELDVIAAAVIGGIAMSGGEGNILGVIIGAAIMGVLRNAFVLLNISAYLQFVVLGSVIVAAVSVDSLRRRGSKK